MIKEDVRDVNHFLYSSYYIIQLTDNKNMKYPSHVSHHISELTKNDFLYANGTSSTLLFVIS